MRKELVFPLLYIATILCIFDVCSGLISPFNTTLPNTSDAATSQYSFRQCSGMYSDSSANVIMQIKASPETADEDQLYYLFYPIEEEQNLCPTGISNCCDPQNDNQLKFKNTTMLDKFYIKTFTESINFTQHHSINETGVYVALLLVCNNTKLNFQIDGSISWFNSYGYLPPDLFPFLIITVVIAVLYSLVAFWLLILCIKYRKELFRIQGAILFATVFSVVETITWLLFYYSLNKTGVKVDIDLMACIFLTTLKETFLCVLLLLLCMGLGVMKWTLGAAQVKIGVFSFVYFVVVLVVDLLRRDSHLLLCEAKRSSLLLIFKIPLYVLLYWWIFLSLIRTMQQLTLRRQTLKLRMYKSFFLVLLVLLGITALFTLLSAIKTSPNLPFQFILESHLDFFLYFIVLLAAAIIWRPRLNNTRYGYAEVYDPDLDKSTDDSKGIPLQVIGSTTIKMRKINSDEEDIHVNKSSYDSEREQNIKDSSQIQLLEQSLTSFVLDDDDNSAEKELRKMD